jgi:hypothetical protein
MRASKTIRNEQQSLLQAYAVDQLAHLPVVDASD